MVDDSGFDATEEDDDRFGATIEDATDEGEGGSRSHSEEGLLRELSDEEFASVASVFFAFALMCKRLVPEAKSRGVWR